MMGLFLFVWIANNRSIRTFFTLIV